MAEKETILDLKNTLTLDGTEYNINAVHSVFADTAEKTQESLTLKKSLRASDSYNASTTFNGSSAKTITYVPVLILRASTP